MLSLNGARCGRGLLEMTPTERLVELHLVVNRLQLSTVYAGVKLQLVPVVSPLDVLTDKLLVSRNRVENAKLYKRPLGASC